MAIELSSIDSELLEVIGGGASEREACAKLGIDAPTLLSRWLELGELLQIAEPETITEYEWIRTYDRVERQRLEADLWSSESRFNALLDISPDAVLLTNGSTGVILKANDPACEWLGYSRRELVGSSVEMLVQDSHREVHSAYRMGFLRNVRKREMGYHPAIAARRKDGGSLWIDVALTATSATDDVLVIMRRVATEETAHQASPPDRLGTRIR